MALKACLFDMDGVIVDLQSITCRLEALVDELSIPYRGRQPRPEGIESGRQLGVHSFGTSATGREDQSEVDDFKECVVPRLDSRHARRGHLARSQRVTEFPLVQEGIQVGLGSSSRNAQLILDNVGLTPLFDTVVDGNHITLSKPDPEVFLKRATALGVEPANVVVFEDAA